MTTPGIVCSENDYRKFRQSQASGNFSISCLTPGQRIGLAVSIRLSCLCPDLIPCAADSRRIPPQLRL
jgi:hypothetical protein